jgi:hypothetical protein
VVLIVFFQQLNLMAEAEAEVEHRQMVVTVVLAEAVEQETMTTLAAQEH